MEPLYLEIRLLRVPKMYKTDRCINLFGHKAHIGKDLRSIPKKIREMFPDLPLYGRICSKCRKEFNATKFDNTELQEMSESSEDDCNPPATKKICPSREEQLEQMLSALKAKYASLDKNDPLRLSILTLAPECWSIRQISTEFGCSEKMARRAKALRILAGVLAMPTSKPGKTLPEATAEKVKSFYEDDIYSRVMPHKNDSVTVMIEEVKEKVQKRLLLCDIKALHTEFKALNPKYPIGLTKFAELRPKSCILAGPKGTHSVCVCITHQNFKNMLDAINVQKITSDLDKPIKDFKDCFSFVTCKTAQATCYLRECQ
ncbi:hypothetical protein ALC62_01154 [Cyphomyrmex costatus]|uniref:Uncharacterized protein n=1 Tax=Cyphomyrmex costatus TaxID=456900 RepID=A0A151IPH9_9HYME|nr:hypothetical protein ALC62_01154 [Cyphomyrmex costatus]